MTGKEGRSGGDGDSPCPTLAVVDVGDGGGYAEKTTLVILTGYKKKTESKLATGVAQSQGMAGRLHFPHRRCLGWKRRPA